MNSKPIEWRSTPVIDGTAELVDTTPPTSQQKDDSQTSLTETGKKQQIAAIVVKELIKEGQFYFDLEHKDYASSMYIHHSTEQLFRIKSDEFTAWLSNFVQLNRASPPYSYIFTAIDDAALKSEYTMGVYPESYWAARSDAIYISCSASKMIKIYSAGLESVINGTDGVLFPTGRTLLPWSLAKPVDPFESCSLFSNVNCLDQHGPELLRIFLYSILMNLETKPPLCLEGPIRSGKTRYFKGICELLGLPSVLAKARENSERDFWSSVNQGGLFVLDNVDTKISWLPDTLANAATGGCSETRALYTNGDIFRMHAKASIGITSSNPHFAADPGLADRLIVVRLGEGRCNTKDSELTKQILGNRDAALTFIATKLRNVLLDKNPITEAINPRHPDFAAFGVRIGRALGREQATIDALRLAEQDKGLLCLQSEPIGTALLRLIDTDKQFEGTAARLCNLLIESDPDMNWLTAKKLSKRLGNLWPHITSVFDSSKRKDGHMETLIFSIKRKPPILSETFPPIKESDEPSL